MQPVQCTYKRHAGAILDILKGYTSRGTRVYLDASRLAHAFFVARGVHPIAVLPTRRGAPRRFALAGRLGVGLDVFADPVRLPPVRPDDLVVIGAVGAYNVNAANAWAGPIPPVVTMRTD